MGERSEPESFHSVLEGRGGCRDAGGRSRFSGKGEEGCGSEVSRGVPGQMANSERLHLDRLRQMLGTRLIGRGEARLFYVPVVDSTNTMAMLRAVEAVPGESLEGLVVLTESQTAGRGRQGRRWVDVAGRNVLLSLVLYPRFPLPLMTMFSALAVLEAIADTAGLVAAIKWPNDILIGE